jgi:hypothetical protein
MSSAVQLEDEALLNNARIDNLLKNLEKEQDDADAAALFSQPRLNLDALGRGGVDEQWGQARGTRIQLQALLRTIVSTRLAGADGGTTNAPATALRLVSVCAAVVPS